MALMITNGSVWPQLPLRLAGGKLDSEAWWRVKHQVSYLAESWYPRNATWQLPRKKTWQLCRLWGNGFLVPGLGFHFEGYWDSVNTNHQLSSLHEEVWRNSAGNKPWGQEPGCGLQCFIQIQSFADNPVQETIPFSDQDPTHTSEVSNKCPGRKISRQEVLFYWNFFPLQILNFILNYFKIRKKWEGGVFIGS